MRHAHIFGGSVDKTVCVWSAANYRLVCRFPAHAEGVWTIATSVDGRWLATGCNDCSIRIWSVAEHITSPCTLVRTLLSHTNKINSLSFSPDHNFLASGSNDTTVRIWDVAGELQRAMRRR